MSSSSLLSDSATLRVIAWAQPDQETLLCDVVQCANLEIIGVAAPTVEGEADLSKAFGVERISDLRHAITRDDVDFLLLVAPLLLESDVRRLIIEQKLPAISLVPQVSTIAELTESPGGRTAAMFAPLMRRSPGFRAAMQILPDFGEIRCVNVFFRSGPGQGTLFSRLYDAMDFINHLCGPVESVNAALAGPLPSVPESAHGLSGHLTFNLRFKPNRSACAALSDQTGSWFRGATILGDRGCVRLSDDGFEWIGEDGTLVDSHNEPSASTVGQLVGQQAARMLADRDAIEPPPDNVALLALCEAARLSCLTGQDETPAKLVQMLSRP